MPITNYLTINQRATLNDLLVQIGMQNSINYSAASNMLNASVMVPNDPAPLVPKTLSFTEITEGLDAATVNKLSADGLVDSFKTAVDGQQHARIDEILAWWTKGSILTGEEAATLEALTSATMPDPNWPEFVPGPSLFKSAFPGFVVNIEGVNYEETCHPLLVKEARGDYS